MGSRQERKGPVQTLSQLLTDRGKRWRVGGKEYTVPKQELTTHCMFLFCTYSCERGVKQIGGDFFNFLPILVIKCSAIVNQPH